jgi:ATP-binding cassette subfamily B protein
MNRSGLVALLRRLLEHLGRRRRWQLGLLLSLTLVSTFAEVISLGAVLPFLGVLTTPEKVFHHPLAANLVRALGISSPEELVLPVTIAFAVSALAAGGIRLLVHWANTKFAFVVCADLSTEMYRRTLYQPYQVHVARNSAYVISGMTDKTFSIAFGVLAALLTLTSTGILIRRRALHDASNRCGCRHFGSHRIRCKLRNRYLDIRKAVEAQQRADCTRVYSGAESVAGSARRDT